MGRSRAGLREDQLKSTSRQGFKRLWVGGEPGNLTVKEEGEAQKLAETKYGNPAWTMERGRQDEEFH